MKHLVAVPALFAALFLFVAAESESTNSVSSQSTNAPLPKASELMQQKDRATNEPTKFSTNMTAVPKLPVYVIPDMILITLPDGNRFVWMAQHHAEELVKMFGGTRITNVVIYSTGLTP